MTAFQPRGMRALPVLEPRRRSLETCVFCPKLCRSTCPVSEAEPRETLTPWGKMTTAWRVARGDAPVDLPHASTAWACTGCLACSAACEHRNPVSEVLDDARRAHWEVGAAPEPATRVVRTFARHRARTRGAAVRLTATQKTTAPSRTALFLGCTYLRALPAEARSALRVASSVASAAVSVAEECCGLPLRLAGDRRGFERQARAVASELSNYDRVLLLDPGCAVTLRDRYKHELGIELSPRLALLVEEAARQWRELGPVVTETPETVRWHDPCQLGRGLGVYEAPRALLAGALGHPPAELPQARSAALCSGGGGLLPATMPDVSGEIARTRLEAHASAGGGRVVTGCASSVLTLRRAAAGTGVAVDDLVTWIERALPRPSRLS